MHQILLITEDEDAVTSLPHLDRMSLLLAAEGAMPPKKAKQRKITFRLPLLKHPTHQKPGDAGLSSPPLRSMRSLPTCSPFLHFKDLHTEELEKCSKSDFNAKVESFIHRHLL